MKALPLKFSEDSTNPYDDWFLETHNGTKAEWEMEEDCDEVVEDQYNDVDLL